VTFVIHIDPAAPTGILAWTDTASDERGGPLPLEGLAAQRPAADNEKTVAVLASQRAASRVMRLPMKRRSDLQRAAGLAFEDQLALGITDPLVAFSDLGEGERLASIVPREDVEVVIEALSAVGLDPDIVTVDHALLPQPLDDEAAVFEAEGLSAVRVAKGGFTVESELAAELVKGLNVRTVTFDDVAHALSGTNFREGPLAKRAPMPSLRPLFAAAGLLVAAGVVFLMAEGIAGYRYAKAASDLRGGVQARFEELYPGTPIIDLERQIRSRSSGPGGSDFIALSAVLNEALGAQERASLSSLSYAEDGELTAELTFAGFSDLEALSSRLRDNGIVVREGSDARREDGAFVTRLYLRAS
jgi:type II secretory pathway component PulL